ncbi:MAG TPA: lysylphosphatidylglycerol synthase transmembrane domain-containing protein [Polyangiaceae bacterium]|nr:lysylphosphatidylglycerol synthase transmembrane domain-containing protein [Polyangiaceae bacterium]
MPTASPDGPGERPDGGAGKPLQSGAWPRIIASLLIGGGFLWLLTRGGLPLIPPKEALAQLPVGHVLAFCALLILGIAFRTHRWTYLIKPIAPEMPARRIMGVCMLGFAAVFLAPLRSGELVRPYLISQGGRPTFMQATGSVAAERIVDGLMVTFFTFVSLSLATKISPLPSRLGDLPLPVAAVPAAAYGALILFSCAFAGMTAFYVARGLAGRVTRRVVGLVSTRAAEFAAGTLERLADGLSFFPSRSTLLRFMSSTLIYWACNILSQWVLLRGLGLEASFAQAAACMGIQGLGSLVPAGPGMFGAFQIAGFSSLAMFFPMEQVKTVGASFVFVTYTVSLVLNVLQVGGGLWLVSKAKK